MNRHGIIAGGNLIVDYIKIIDYYPDSGMVCRIEKDVVVAVGGGPHNVLVTLSKLKMYIPLSVVGLVGEDQGAELIIKELSQNGVSTQYVQKVSGLKTSFTDVFTENSTGVRTLFHYPGANTELDYKDFLKAAEESTAKIFVLQYLLRLRRLDEEDPEFGLVSARALSLFKEKGFKTAADMSSLKSEKFPLIVKHCLKFIHYLIINEIEAQSMSNFLIREENGGFNKGNLEKSAEFLINNGVIELVVIHLPEGGYAKEKNGKTYWQESFKVDKSEIKSTVGCGDAFNAGMLFSLHQELPVSEGLKIANACARFCLFDYTTTGGATTFENIAMFLGSVHNK